MWSKYKGFVMWSILVIYFSLLICLLFFSSNITPHITVVLPEFITQMVSLGNHAKFIFLITSLILVSIFCLILIHYFFNAYSFQIISFIPILILSFIRSWSYCNAISVAGFKVVSNTAVITDNLFGSSVLLLFVSLFLICLLISNYIITKYGSQLSAASETATTPLIALQFLRAALDNTEDTDASDKESKKEVEEGKEQKPVEDKGGKAQDEKSEEDKEKDKEEKEEPEERVHHFSKETEAKILEAGRIVYHGLFIYAIFVAIQWLLGLGK